MFVTLLPNRTLVRLLQPRKAKLLIRVTVFGIVMWGKLVQNWKPPKRVTLLPIVNDCNTFS